MRIKEKQRRVNRYIKNLNKNVADLGWHFKQVGRKIYNISDGVAEVPIRPYYYFQQKHSEKIEDDAGFCQSQEYPRILLLLHCNGKASLQVYVNILKAFNRAVIILIKAV